MAPTQPQQAAQNGASFGVKAGFRIAKNTMFSKGLKEKSSNILLRALRKTAEAYELELMNAIRLWSSIGGHARSHLYVAAKEPSDERTFCGDLSQEKDEDKVGFVERYTTEIGDGERASESPGSETIEAGTRYTEDVNVTQAVRSDELLEAERQERGSAPSLDHNERYHREAKDGSLNKEGEQGPAGLSWRTPGNDEDSGNGGGEGYGNDEGGRASNEEVASISEVNVMGRKPTTKLEDGTYSCAWSDCTVTLRDSATKSAGRSHVNMDALPFRWQFQECRSPAGANFENARTWKGEEFGVDQEKVDHLKRLDFRRYSDAENMEGHLEVFHSSQWNLELKDEETEISALTASWKRTGNVPSREENEIYSGDAKDGLFSAGNASVPSGLRDRAAAGDDADDEDDKMGGAGDGGEDGDDGDDEDGYGRTPNSSNSKLTRLEAYQLQLMLLGRENKKKLGREKKQIEVSVQECGCEECATWQKQLDQYLMVDEIQHWFLRHLRRQGNVVSPSHADDRSATYNTTGEWLLKRQRQQRGSAPSRGLNECYNGGAEDGLFAGGGAQIPQGLVNRAAGRGLEGSSPPTRGMGGGDGGDDGNGSNGPGARLDEQDQLNPHPLQNYQEQMMLLEQLNKRTWMAKHGRAQQLPEKNTEDDGDYEMVDGWVRDGEMMDSRVRDVEMVDAWEREGEITVAATGEDGSSFHLQYELGDELTANPWIQTD